jgi:hypothetical protein
MNIVTDAPVIVNGESKKTAFSDMPKNDFSETGNYDFMRTEFKEDYHSMDGGTADSISKNIGAALMVGGVIAVMYFLGAFD